MKVLNRTLATLVALCVLTLSASALGVGPMQKDPKPPPKEPQKIEPEKKPPPPPRDNDKGGGNDKKGGKP